MARVVAPGTRCHNRVVWMSGHAGRLNARTLRSYVTLTTPCISSSGKRGASGLAVSRGRATTASATRHGPLAASGASPSCSPTRPLATHTPTSTRSSRGTVTAASTSLSTSTAAAMCRPSIASCAVSAIAWSGGRRMASLGSSLPSATTRCPVWRRPARPRPLSPHRHQVPPRRPVPRRRQAHRRRPPSRQVPVHQRQSPHCRCRVRRLPQREHWSHSSASLV